MINEILKATRLPYHETQFTHRAPARTYAIYLDDVEPDGGDLTTLIYRHNVTIELYEPEPDPEAEAAVERELNARGIKWRKQSRFWIREELRYQVVYENITYIEKL